MTQQFYVIRRMPAPGSPAEKAMQERRKLRGHPIQELSVPGLATGGDDEPEVEEAEPTPRQRQQPKGKKRSKKGKGQTGGGGQASAHPRKNPRPNQSKKSGTNRAPKKQGT